MHTVGQHIPEFAVRACCGIEDTDLVDLTRDTFAGMWTVFAFLPHDNVGICASELLDFAQHVHDFERRRCVILGASADTDLELLAWRRSDERLKSLPFPLIASADLARGLGVFDDASGTCRRATYIVDPAGVIQHACAHHTLVARSINETLRTLDALQTGKPCPLDWTPTEPARTPSGPAQ